MTANGELKTVDIKGKPYVDVAQRIKYFRGHCPGHRLISKIVELTEKHCIIEASVIDWRGEVVANGLAREVNGSTYINKTSYVENCETSAWGRALGNFGIGIDASVASANEVMNAQANQPDSDSKQNGDKGGKARFTKPPAGQQPPETSRDKNQQPQSNKHAWAEALRVKGVDRKSVHSPAQFNAVAEALAKHARIPDICKELGVPDFLLPTENAHTPNEAESWRVLETLTRELDKEELGEYVKLALAQMQMTAQT